MNSSQFSSSVAASSTTSTTVPTAPAVVDEFMHTPEFRRHFFEFVYVQTLMALRLATKGWNAAADALIDEGVRSGELMVPGGNDLSDEFVYATEETWRELVTRVIFFLNITKIGENACSYAVNLIVVDNPEGVESIGRSAFEYCTSLTTVSFPTTLKYIGFAAFYNCTRLDNVDLHTNLQELGEYAFYGCSNLTSILFRVHFKSLVNGSSTTAPS